MLDVAYEAVDDLPPGRLARIDEDRGRIRVHLDEHADLQDVIRQLNIEVDHLMSSAHWFQLWDDEIVSSNTPDRPLRVEYLLRSWVPAAMGVCVTEDKGLVRVYVCPTLNTTDFAAWMNPAAKTHLEAGHWFQLYAGEIIDNGPEPMSRV
jgi:hypothetical protein